MSDQVLTIGIAIFGALGVLLLVVALRRRSAGDPEMDDASGRSAGSSSSAGNRGLRVLGSLLRPGEGAAMEQLQSRARRAGLYSRDALDLFLTVRLIAIACGLGTYLLMLGVVESPLAALVLLVVIVGVTLVAPSAWLDSRGKQRQQQIAESLPEMLELLAISLEAGANLEQALSRLVAAGDEEELLVAELEIVMSDVRVGMSVPRAFSRFAARIGSEEAGALAALVAKASSLGARISDLLRAHARSMREQQLMALEEKAGKANAQLSLPLAIFLLPAGLLLLVGPAFLALFEML